MADWIRCTAAGTGRTIFVNLDSAAIISKGDKGSSITLASGEIYAVKEPVEELIVQTPVRSNA